MAGVDHFSLVYSLLKFDEIKLKNLIFFLFLNSGFPCDHRTEKNSVSKWIV